MTRATADAWGELCQAPPAPEPGDDWHRRLVRWRDDARAAIAYDGARYEAPELAWTRSCFVCGMLMLWDQALDRPGRGELQVLDVLRQAVARFGGFDAGVLWHAYPRIGFDDRDQFDYYRQLPGGLAGLRELVEECHSLGTRAILAYCPWDIGTRREPAGQIGTLVEMVATVGADGIFLDTLARASTELLGRLPSGLPGVALMTEDTVPLEQVADHPMSWAQWPPETTSPYVLRNKWFEPRHMQFLVRRWHRDHGNELHLAWLNGAGVVVWENVFGTLNPWSSRDEALLRLMRPVQRLFGDVFRPGRWSPLVPTSAGGTYASRWEVDGLRLWTVANMTAEPVRGSLLPVDVVVGDRYWDLLQGTPVTPTEMSGRPVLAGEIGAYGIAAFAAGPDRAQERLEPLLRPRPPVRLVTPSQVPTAAPAQVPIAAPAAPVGAPDPWEGDDLSAGTMRRFETFRGELTVRYRLRECGLDGPPPLADAVAPVLHQVITETRRATLRPYAIDVRPVTNAQFRSFLAGSGYRPRFGENFLRHWPAPTGPSTEQAGSPVVFVDLDDARAYCRWAGKRLPTPFEWQHAMGWDQVGYGVERVWEWTQSESSDGHTRSSILKGGADYRAWGSDWYADGGVLPPDWCAKFIRLGPALDRCATIGFRCAMDLRAPGPPHQERPYPGAREATM